MTVTLTDDLLLAYADQRLDPQTHAAVAAQLADDPAALARVEHLQATHRLLGDAFADEADEPVPEWLVAAVQRVPPPAADGDPAERPATPEPEQGARVIPLRRRAFTSMLPPALAALLLLGVGIGAGWWANEHLGPASPGLAARDTLLQQALEERASGEVLQMARGDTRFEVLPLLTFRDRQGRICREFETRTLDNDGLEDRLGIACRGAGGWVDEVMVSRNLLDPSAGDDGFYSPVSGEDQEPGPFEQLSEQLMDSAPLDPAEEIQLLERGWQP